MEDNSIAYKNLLSMEFWQQVMINWGALSVASRKKWLDKSIQLTADAWAVATAGTDLAMPSKYDDFRFTVAGKSVYSVKMFYARLDKKCKNTWNNVVVTQVLYILLAQYALRDAGI